MKKIGLLAYGEMGLSALKGLSKKFVVDWVVLSPDNKNEELSTLAKKNKIETLFTNSNEDILNKATETKPDAIVIASYNKIIPEEALLVCPWINVHHGNLPKYRGRAGINWAIIQNKKTITVTIHKVVANLDAGPIYKKYTVKISSTDTVKTVYEKVNKIVEKNLPNIVSKVLQGFKGKKQVGIPTYTCTRLPEDGLIDWSKTTLEIYNLIRALTKPFPGAFTFFDNKKLVIWSAEVPKNPKKYEASIPGRVCEIYKNTGVEVLTGDSSIIIKDVLYKKKEYNATEVITSVKKTLGINVTELYELLNKKML